MPCWEAGTNYQYIYIIIYLHCHKHRFLNESNMYSIYVEHNPKCHLHCDNPEQCNVSMLMILLLCTWYFKYVVLHAVLPTVGILWWHCAGQGETKHLSEQHPRVNAGMVQHIDKFLYNSWNTVSFLQEGDDFIIIETNIPMFDFLPEDYPLTLCLVNYPNDSLFKMEQTTRQSECIHPSLVYAVNANTHLHHEKPPEKSKTFQTVMTAAPVRKTCENL